MLHVLALLTCVLGFAPPGAASEPLRAAEEGPVTVPVEEYPVYDRVVQDKFLTSQTSLVIVRRLTATRLAPGAQDPPTRDFFDDLEGPWRVLDPQLVTDFIAKAGQASWLEPRFDFGVPYRFAVGDRLEGPEVSLAPRPVQEGMSPQPGGPPAVLGVLEFSRVGFNGRADQALVYVGIDRPDSTGAGFLVWLSRPGTTWRIAETNVLWMARP